LTSIALCTEFAASALSVIYCIQCKENAEIELVSIDIHALGIDQLSVPDRLTLIEQICETLPEQVAPSEVSEWHRQELAKRLEHTDVNPGLGRPWREV
jgi:putative addiction module component (TIGR02574 family)